MDMDFETIRVADEGTFRLHQIALSLRIGRSISLRLNRRTAESVEKQRVSNANPSAIVDVNTRRITFVVAHYSQHRDCCHCHGRHRCHFRVGA